LYVVVVLQIQTFYFYRWCNADQDMLSCTSCASAVAILPIPSHVLSTNSIEKICQAYRTKIVTYHQDDCPFGWQSCQWERQQQQQHEEQKPWSTNHKNSFVVPSYMALVIPEKSVLLMQHPTPSKLIRESIQEIQQAALLHLQQQQLPPLSKTPTATPAKSTPSTLSFPWLHHHHHHHQVPTEIQQFFHDMSISTNDKMKSLLALDKKDNDEHSMIIFSLAILGWIPIISKKQTTNQALLSPTNFSLGCPLCLARMELDLEHTTTTTTTTRTDHDHITARPTKRPRKLVQQQQQKQQYHYDYKNINNTHPLDAHRYYCPYRCGFPASIMPTPSSTPVWKRILDRLRQELEPKQQEQHYTIKAAVTNTSLSSSMTTFAMTEEKEKSMDRSIDKVRQILRAGMVQPS
jgi:hypothetical protein